MTKQIELYSKSYAPLPEVGHRAPLPEGANGYYAKEDDGVMLYHQTRGACAYIGRMGFFPVSLGRINDKRVYLSKLMPLEIAWILPLDGEVHLIQGAIKFTQEVYS